MLLDEDDVDPAAVEAIERGLSAQELIEWADTLDPASQVNRAAVLTSVAQFLGYRGRDQDALNLYRAAVEDGSPVPPDSRIWLADGLLKVGGVEDARTLFEEVTRDRPTDPDVYNVVGESWEEHGDLEEAHRWFTLGWTRCLKAEAADTRATLHLLVCRSRVREALELPVDDLDEVAAEYLRERRRERGRGASPSIQAFVPRAEWEAWPYDRPPGNTFEEQVLLVERVLREDPASSGVICVPLDSTGLTVFASDRDLDPGSYEARIDYAKQRVADGQGLAWPPGRNEPCWCGSATKYKKCCGRPPGM